MHFWFIQSGWPGIDFDFKPRLASFGGASGLIWMSLVGGKAPGCQYPPIGLPQSSVDWWWILAG